MTPEEKLRLISAHFAKEKAESPDGKTSWERVEEFRLRHGHLPDGFSRQDCEACQNERESQ